MFPLPKDRTHGVGMPSKDCGNKMLEVQEKKGTWRGSIREIEGKKG